MLDIISPTIVLDTLAGMLIEKAATAIYEKYNETDKEKTAKAIKKIIDQKIHGNADYSYLLDWNKAVQASNLLLIDYLKAEGIYISLKLYQERHGFYNNDGVLIKSDDDLLAASKDLSNSLRQEVKLKDIVREFDKEYKEAERDANDEHMRTQLDQILSQLERMQIHDDNDVYLREFGDTLFLDKKRNQCITLKTMYCSPDIILDRGRANSASEAINNWLMHDDDHSVLLLFGDAGVGKSSLCRKMVWDAIMPNNPKKEFCIQGDRIHVIPLRKYLPILEKWDARFGIWELLKTLFDIKRSPFRNELFVLDGLDEVEVLCPSFPIDGFFDDLQSFAEYDMKIMITSRRTDHIKNSGDKAAYQKESRIQCRTLLWKDETVQNWCEHYSKYRFDLDFDRWMQKFLDFYYKLPANNIDDSRREILRIPIVLYIVCNAEVDLHEDSSICTIYDQAFHTILDREHIRNSTMQNVLDSKKSPEEAIARQVQWQFTKELAFQMFLYGSLTLSDAEQPGAIANAKSRTITILIQNGVQITPDYPIDTQAYFAVFHFARDNTDKTGIVFAHKTVYEYFTAVKLYEDYLSMPNIEQQSPEMVWENLISAFRYKKITDDILGHLKVLHQKGPSNNFCILGKHFSYGIAYQLIVSQLFSVKPVPEYVIPRREMNDDACCPSLPTKQISFLLSNLTHYMCERGYTNNALSGMDLIYFKYSMQILLYDNVALQVTNSFWDDNKDLDWNIYQYDLRKWEMPFFVFRGSNLRSANLAGTNLERANLAGANLECANLEHASLGGAHLEGANLERANLCNAYLQGKKLEGVYLMDANLERANLEHARLAGANLERANLAGARLTGANLAGANLKHANLKHANLAGANLAGARLTGANLQGAFYSEKTTFPADFDPHKRGMRCVD